VRYLSKNLQTVKEGLLDLVFPRQDLVSGEALEYKDDGRFYLSQDSSEQLQFIHEPVCNICGFPLFGKTEGSAGCEKCAHLKPHFESNRSVLLINRIGRRLVHDLKYHKGTYLLRDIERIMLMCVELKSRVAERILVPVPLHARKLRERGYNQSALIAEGFRKTLGNENTKVIHLLKRVKDTDSQTLMDRKTRLNNVNHAFELNTTITLDLSTPISIIDDIFTTGSTINACADVLRRTGYKNVQSLTLGHG